MPTKLVQVLLQSNAIVPSYVLEYLHAYQQYFDLNPEITTRDRDGVQKTFSGLMKVLFPDGICTKVEMEELLVLSLEGRRRVKEQLVKLDETFTPVSFTYTDRVLGKVHTVVTWEEKQYPSFARRDKGMPDKSAGEALVPASVSVVPTSALDQDARPGHLVVAENTKNYSYRRLFAAHLRGAREVTVVDPYVRAFWQVRNFMELVQLIRELTPEGEETKVRLITKSDPERCVEQDDVSGGAKAAR